MNRFKTRFLNMAAHELNTPITPMRLQLHLLRVGALGTLHDSQQKAVDILDRNLNRLAGLVQEILDVARLDAGGLRMRLEPFSLDAAVKEAWEAYEEPARRLGIRLLAPAASHAMVFADRARTGQVLYNLLSNAVKFTPADGEIRMVLRRSGKAMEVVVFDTGLGMAPEQLRQLFQPFARVHEESVAGGTGLGLYVSRGLAEAMGGTLTAASDGPGRGASFRLTLPLSDRPQAVIEAPLGGPEDLLATRLRELI